MLQGLMHIDQKWIPGMSAPFDPAASKLTQKFRIKVIYHKWKKNK